MLGMVWAVLVVGVAGAILAALGLGSFLFRGPRR
jgi:hypothetical protein